MVVRESMSMDLLDRLIADICSVTQFITEADKFDLSAWQPFSESVEKQHASPGISAKDKHHKAKRPMSEGVHRAVC